MTDGEQHEHEYYSEVVEYATQKIVGDKQELTVIEMQEITFLVAQIMTGEQEMQS